MELVFKLNKNSKMVITYNKIKMIEVRSVIVPIHLQKLPKMQNIKIKYNHIMIYVGKILRIKINKQMFLRGKRNNRNLQEIVLLRTKL